MSHTIRPDIIAWQTIRAASLGIARHRLTATVDGSQHIPDVGPAVIVARHVHHLYDGCLLFGALPRPAHIVVGLDWVRSPGMRWLMETACAVARWPVVLRVDRLATPGIESAYRPAEALRYLRGAMRLGRELLAAGRLVIVFPEAYPAIEPGGQLTRPLSSMLPLRDGFVRLIEQVEHPTHQPVPVIPAGLVYDDGRRWTAGVRFGRPIERQTGIGHREFVETVEEQLRDLSQVEPAAEFRLRERRAQ